MALLFGLAGLGSLRAVGADTANAPSLVISQLKITSSNGQFVTLYNGGETTLDMSKYQLEYFNSYDLTKASSSRLIPLTGAVPPHGYFMVSDGELQLCYQMAVDSVSLGFSSTAGLIEVLGFNQNGPGGSVSPTLQDYVGWSKSAATGAQTLPANTSAFLQRLPVNAQNNPAINVAGSGNWQAVQYEAASSCKLVTVTTPATTVLTGLNQLLPPSQPPAIILPNFTSTDVTASLPDADIGLIAPQITEILPNPLGTGNDASDEFIELYNANTVAFDLTGFTLQTGLTSLHTYTFPSGTSLPPLSFTAFYSKSTGLSMSNTSGQVALLDPADTVLSITVAYATAADGVSWNLANGGWFWTTTLTPGATNVIVPPSTKKAVTKSTIAKTTKTTKTTKTAKTTSAKTKLATTKTAGTTTAAYKSVPDSAVVTPIHPWTLALVAIAALLYGAYEYRTDLANRLYRFRKHLGARRRHRVETPRR